MLKASYLITLSSVLFVLGGCPSGDDDDATDDACKNPESIQSEADLEALAQCESIEGDISIRDQDWLSTIEWPLLTSLVNSALKIEDNAALTSVDIPSLEGEVFRLYFRDNHALTTISMPGVEHIDLMGINDNDSLLSLDGLSGVESVGSSLDIVSNDCLSEDEAEAFAAGVIVDGDVSVFDNGANYPCD